jgi:hypothetical protein
MSGRIPAGLNVALAAPVNVAALVNGSDIVNLNDAVLRLYLPRVGSRPRIVPVHERGHDYGYGHVHAHRHVHVTGPFNRLR